LDLHKFYVLFGGGPLLTPLRRGKIPAGPGVIRPLRLRAGLLTGLVLEVYDFFLWSLILGFFLGLFVAFRLLLILLLILLLLLLRLLFLLLFRLLFLLFFNLLLRLLALCIFTLFLGFFVLFVLV
jgi:hypothetical protein